MTFVSYAQNFEDVLLWRALGHLQTGFYIDIGASHPDIDSVTRAFYDRGWHGISVEPTAAAFLRLTAARPRDINLRLALGTAPGTMPFYVVEGADAGLSTLDHDAASSFGTRGVEAIETLVEVDTLASVCRTYAPAEIHFLKIDVEGAERAVLEGADFATHRPWIVLVEATAPMSTRETHADWDDILIDAEYRFVWFDGLNRFYVALEHFDRLSPHFRTPPNVFDDFLRAADTEWTRRLSQAEARAAADVARSLAAESRTALAEGHVVRADRRTAVAEDRAEAAYLRLAQVTTHASRAQTTAERYQADADRLQRALDAALRHAQLQSERADRAEQAHATASDWLEATRRSTSWKLTGPLRRVLRAAGRTGGSPPDPVSAPPPPREAIAAPPLPPPSPVLEPPKLAPERLRAVHQFHSGTAVGDAITNAMLLTRDLLRRLGYDSEIFAEHRAPGCEDEIYPLDAMPADPAYALIVRHSMGHDALPRILALPVPKLLLYHNITPPELLADNPHMQAYAVKGREQLATLKPAVAAALADSEYNAFELRQAGYPSVAACPLLFDIDRMLAFVSTPQRGPVFTVLFVGRLTRSKGQRELITAFVRFRNFYAGESRLVLVGRNDEGPYVRELLDHIKHLELHTGAVELTGLVSDAELARWYATADLYVSLSQHEGFGVPLVEAMAHGVPVLAWPSGAVPYTLGGTAVLLEDTTPAHVAAQMLDLASDPAQRDAVADRQRRSLDRFRVDRQVPILVAALEQVGVRPPQSPAATEAQIDNMHFTVAGHVNGTYSLAEVNRALAFALEIARPGAVRLLAVEGDVVTDISAVPPDQRHATRALITRPAPPTGPHVVITQHYPIWLPETRGDLTLAMFFWEESLVPADTVATLNAKLDGVLAPSRVVAKALIDSGVTAPVRVVGQAPLLDRFRAVRDERPARRPPGPFHFLHVSSGFPRKGVDVLLAAYAAAFRRGDAVKLTIKTFPNPHNDVAAQLDRLRANDPDAPDIELIDADLPADALLDLYRHADAMVLPSRGEGFNLPAAEALAAGLALIVTGHGGHMDFVAAASDAVRLVDYTLAAAATHLSTPFSLWAEPDPADLAAALREAVQRPQPRPADLPFAAATVANTISRFAAELLQRRQAREPSIAVMTTWDVACGIAGYSRQLADALPGVTLILADRRTPANPVAAPRIIPAWTVGSAAALHDLAAALIHHDPRIVLMQHQPGLLPWRDLATVLALPALYGRVLCVVLHNTRQILDVSPEHRRSALDALATASRVVVHTTQDVARLAGLGLRDNVTLIPQGVPPPAHTAAPPPRALSPDEPVLIGCYGFFLPDKGILQLIEALPLVRQHYPHARLRLVNAEYPVTLSAIEIAASKRLTTALGLDEVVELVTEFLTEDQSTRLLRECDVIVLPYQRSKEASSAALRSAMAAEVPIAVTPLPLFDEADDAVARLPGMLPAELAEGIVALLASAPTRRDVASNAASWRSQRDWVRVGRRWTGMLHGLSASGVVMGAHDGAN